MRVGVGGRGGGRVTEEAMEGGGVWDACACAVWVVLGEEDVEVAAREGAVEVCVGGVWSVEGGGGEEGGRVGGWGGGGIGGEGSAWLRAAKGDTAVRG